MNALATQQEANFATAQAQAHIEDVALLVVLQEAGVDPQTARVIFHQEVA